MSKKYPNSQFEITDIEFPNKGIGFWADKKVSVKNTLPGQTIIADVMELNFGSRIFINEPEKCPPRKRIFTQSTSKNPLFSVKSHAR